jgi:amino acid adenylation domain-containing protein
MPKNASDEVWFPLSIAQSSRWFLYQLDPASQGTHNNGFAARVHGCIDLAAIADALKKLIRRHPMLRVRFRQYMGRPQQCVTNAVRASVSSFDVSGIEEKTLEQRILRDCLLPFDLTQPPLVRACLYRRSEEESVLLLVFEHIVVDGWSYWRILEELGELLATGPNDDNREEAVTRASFFDYIAWQQAWLTSAAGESQWRYWQQNLGQESSVLQLHTDQLRPARSGRRQDTVKFTLSRSMTQELREVARQQAGTLFITLLAAYQILLHRHTGQDEIIVGCPLPARSKREWDRVIGEFINTIPIRSNFEGDPSVAEVLKRVRGTALRGMANQEYPIARLVERLHPTRDRAETPFFQTLFIFQKARGSQDLLSLSAGDDARHQVAWGGVVLKPFPLHQSGGAGNMDLVLEVVELGDSVGCRFKFDMDLFDRGMIERLAGHYQTLLGSMVADKGQRVSQLPLLTATERRQVLEEFNATAVEYGPDQLVHQLFERRAAANPELIAVICEEEALTYGELNRRANQLARYLIGLGIRPDDRVALCVERSLEMVVGLLGILKAGAAYVPLDPNYPAERLAYLLKDSMPLALLTQQALLRRLPVSAIPVLRLDRDAALLAPYPETNPQPQALGLTSLHLAYVIYTSGTTGTPKGVMVPHAAVVNRLVWAQAEYCLVSEDRVLQKTPFTFDVSVWEFFWPLLAGAQLVMARPGGHQDSQYLAKLIELTGITTIHFVPSLLHVFLDQANMDGCHSLRRVLCSGEALPSAVQLRLHDRLPQVALHNLYGPTEAAVDVTFCRCTPELCVPTVPIGRPIANTQIYVFDGRMRPVPVGVTGELYIGGAGVARGYLNRPDLTAERFVPDPYSKEPGARLYQTGDLGRWRADGTIEYVGRNDFQVKIRGFRIELGEIEAKLLACAGVREAVVVARQEMPGDQRLVAYLVAEEGFELKAAELRTELGHVLAEYMVPSAFVILESLPVMPNGKLDRRALPAPDQTSVVTRAYEAPQGEVETAIAQIWQELLGLQRVGRNDHFFELGGHSLLVLIMLERFRERALHADVRTVFSAPTLAALAAAIATNGRQHTGGLEALPNRICHEATNLTPEMLPLEEVNQAEIKSMAARVSQGMTNIRGSSGDLFGAGLQVPISATHQSIDSSDTGHLLNGFLKALPDTSDTTVADREHSYSPAVIIQRGSPTVRPLFCVSGAGANVTVFSDLAQALGPDVPIYGLQPRGLDGVLRPYNDVPTAARDYLKAIRHISPSGPYQLLGHSFGGWVVFEMACQLAAFGESVPTLVLLDTEPPSFVAGQRKQYSRVETLMELVKLLELTRSQPLALCVADFATLDHVQQLNLLLNRMIEANVLPASTTIQALGGMVRVFESNLNVDYLPTEPYLGPIHLVCALDHMGTAATHPNNDADLLIRWLQHAPRTTVWRGCGNHMTLLTSPWVNRLAEWLRPRLGSAHGGPLANSHAVGL